MYPETHDVLPLSGLLGALPEPTLALSPFGEVVACNQAAVDLFGQQAPVGRQLTELAADPELARHALARGARATQPVPVALTLETDSGPQPCTAHCSRLRGANGSQGWVLIRLLEQHRASGGSRSLSKRVSLLEREIDRRARAEMRAHQQVELLELIAEGAAPGAVADAVCRFIERQSPGHALASVLLVRSGKLVHAAGPKLPADYCDAIDGLAIGPAGGSCGTAAYTGKTVVVSDIQTDPRWDEYRDLAESCGLRACWSVPVCDDAGAVVATVAQYFTEPRAPSRDELMLSELAGHLLSLALDRERRMEQLRRHAEQLAASDAHKDELLAMLGHELRNPLSPMVMTVEMLRRSGLSADERTRYLDLLADKLSLMRLLVDGLLDVARVTQGKIEIRARVLDLRGTVEAALAGDIAGDARIEVELPDRPVWVRGDPYRLNQALDALVDNARKFTPADGRIDIEIRRDGDSAVLIVRDDGIGIDPATLPRVFDLFTQGARELPRREGGLGIGLTLVRAIARSHGGSVIARSEGAGTEIELRIPVDEPDAVADFECSSATGENDDSLGILVVDDDLDNADLLEQILRGWGHEIETANDGGSAIVAAMEHRPQVVVLDIGLPVLDGYEVARKLRATEGFGRGSCTLIALTGYGMASDRELAFDAGFDAFLVKPVDLDRLRSLIEIAARGRLEARGS